MSAPAGRPPKGRKSAAGEVAAAGVLGLIGLFRLAFTVFGVLVIVLGVLGYHRAHTPEFKLQCAAYQAHIAPMGFPDNALCFLFWQLG